MAVPVSTSVDGFQPGTPAALFKGPPNADRLDVSADGKRLLFPVPAGGSAQAPFTIVQNWISLLKKQPKRARHNVPDPTARNA